MNKTKFVKNVIFGFGGQFIIIALGIIVPRIMITSYGSDVNGLLSTITQIFTYMALLEAGIGQAAKNALYKPIYEKDNKGISYVASVARRYYRRITFYYGIAVILLAILAPLVLKTKVDYLTVFLVIFFEGMSGVCTFYFIQTPTVILNADGHGYVNNAFNVVNKTASYAIKILMATFGINIVFLQFIYFLIAVAKIIFYRSYLDRKYRWIDYKEAPKSAILKDRNSFIITEITWTIFSSTDMIVLSTFVSTQLSSVYGIYSMVFSNINVLLNTVYNSVSYVLGQTYHENIDEYKKVHDIFGSMFFGGMTVLMSITYLLILPFIRLYMRGVTDIDYIYTSLPVMFCLIQILSWSRYVSGNLIGVAGRIRKALKINVAEASINLVLSIIFVHKFGIIGVLFATVIALPLKVIYCNYVADHIILKRSLKNTLKILGGNYSFFAFVVFAENFIDVSINSYGDFLLYGIIFSIVLSVLGIAVNCIINPDCARYIVNILKKRRVV